MSNTLKPSNPYTEHLKNINEKYLEFVSNNRVPFYAYMWGIDRKINVIHPNVRIMICSALLAVTIVLSIKHVWLIPAPIFMILCGVGSLWFHFSRKRSIDGLVTSLTAEERTSMAKALRDMLTTDTEMSVLASYKVESDSKSIKENFDSCHENLAIATREFAFNLICDKPDPMIVVESVQFLMFDEPINPAYWWDIELLGQYTYTGFVTRLETIKRIDQEKVADANNKKLLSEQLAAL